MLLPLQWEYGDLKQPLKLIKRAYVDSLQLERETVAQATSKLSMSFSRLMEKKDMSPSKQGDPLDMLGEFESIYDNYQQEDLAFPLLVRRNE